MPPVRFKSVSALEENCKELYLQSTDILIRIARNIINEPGNPKFRSISLGSSAVTNILLNACGAMECLFEMGFQERDDKLILPQEASLGSLKNIYSELLTRRGKFISSNTAPKPLEKDKSKQEIKISAITNDLVELGNQTKDSFLKKILFWCFYVLKYENHELQKKAMSLIPIAELNLNVMKNIRTIQMECKRKELKEEIVDYQELLLVELCNWFNSDFFEWVNTPKCPNCGFIETIDEGTSDEVFPGADRVEVYRCHKCSEIVLFPRYNDPDKLLETRKGRCGEWANCFCLLCRAMGWDSRLVFDETDHVWVEVYSILKSRWIHCDPCENAVDTPLMYECGWHKKLSYVIAYSKDEVQDVTWRYSNKHKRVLKNRKKCSEADLVDFILKVRNVMLKHASDARRNFVIKRSVLELVDLMQEKSAGEGEDRGRISGSLAWRLLRGETSDQDFKPHVWKVVPEGDSKRFVLAYNTSKDQYLLNYRTKMNGWKNGVYKMESVFKKVEKDWKMTYLAVMEDKSYGTITWRFETQDNFAIGNIELVLIRCTFGSGKVSWKICSDNVCISPADENNCCSTKAFNGLKSIDVTVELFAGSGANGWQHAQILRQPLSSEEETFLIIIDLIHQ